MVSCFFSSASQWVSFFFFLICIYEPFPRYIPTWISFWSVFYSCCVSHASMQIGAQTRHVISAGVLKQIGPTIYSLMAGTNTYPLLSLMVKPGWKWGGDCFASKRIWVLKCCAWNKSFPLSRTIHMDLSRHCWGGGEMGRCRGDRKSVV